MKLLFVGTNHENTGAATHFVSLAKAVRDAGHEVECVVSRKGLMGEALMAAGVPVFYSTFRNVYDLRGYIATIRRIRNLQPDWLIGNFGKEYWPLLALGRIWRIPVALFRHRTPRMSRISEYCVPRLARRFIAVSEYARDQYLRWGVPAHCVHISYNSVDTAQFRPDPARGAATRRVLGIDADAIVLGYVGRMHGGKGVQPLMLAVHEAMQREPRLHMLWIGSGPDLKSLQNMAAQGGSSHRHHFSGWVSDPEQYYNAMSMLAFPSVCPETFGRVAIEAEACGVPVLGSDVGGIPETMQHGVTGYLLEPGDVIDWREQILALCHDRRREDMGLSARAFVEEHFGNAAVGRDFVQLLQRGEESLHQYRHAPV